MASPFRKRKSTRAILRIKILTAILTQALYKNGSAQLSGSSKIPPGDMTFVIFFSALNALTKFLYSGSAIFSNTLANFISAHSLMVSGTLFSQSLSLWINRRLQTPTLLFVTLSHISGITQTLKQ
jgi:hypothetical protein